jgi:hypothetical protein
MRYLRERNIDGAAQVGVFVVAVSQRLMSIWGVIVIVRACFHHATHTAARGVVVRI